MRWLAESAKDFGKARRKALKDVFAAARVVACADIIPAHDSIAPGTRPRCAFRTQLFHWSFPFLRPCHLVRDLQDGEVELDGRLRRIGREVVANQRS